MKKIVSAHAAFQEVDITPTFPVEIIGGPNTNVLVDTVLHRLYAQILLLQLTETCCVITIDSLGLTTQLAQIIKEDVASVLEIRSCQVMLNFSHTHNAPAPLSEDNGKRYFALLKARILEGVQKGKQQLQPCLVSWAVTDVAIATNRRAGCTVVDNRLGALQICHVKTKEPIVLLLRIAAHANILMTKKVISSDYIGVARSKMKQLQGYPAMILQGAAGNLKPMGVDTIYGGEIEDVNFIAEKLLQAITKLHFQPIPLTRLVMFEKEITMISKVPTTIEAKQMIKDSKMDGEAWLQECIRLRENQIFEQSQMQSISFLIINEGCLCGIADEIFCEIALRVADKFTSPYIFFNGYTNGCTGYLPHEEEWVKGGYETLYSYLTFYSFHQRVMPFNKETAQQIESVVVATIKEYLW